ncbi:MAG: hypothetical protein HQL56_07980 [Magnetococcales bacterium]|nr:hypothetical protein [Magnetococcales bacterium]
MNTTIFNKQNIDEWLLELSKKRPIFHSEADFQHALACFLYERYSDARIRLERPVSGTAAVDIWMEYENIIYIIELKYPKRKGRFFPDVDGGEEFNFPEGSRDDGRFGILNDLSRVEWFVDQKQAQVGIVICITNDPLYWNGSRRGNDMKFALKEGHEITGNLAWAEKAAAKTKAKGSLKIHGKYIASWTDYSRNAGSNGIFRFLTFIVEEPSQPNNDVVLLSDKKESSGKGHCKERFRNLFYNQKEVTWDDLKSLGCKESTIITYLSDFNNHKYCGKGGVLNIIKQEKNGKPVWVIKE